MIEAGMIETDRVYDIAIGAPLDERGKTEFGAIKSGAFDIYKINLGTEKDDWALFSLNDLLERAAVEGNNVSRHFAEDGFIIIKVSKMPDISPSSSST